jgi:hypothetical protein
MKTCLGTQESVKEREEIKLLFMTPNEKNGFFFKDRLKLPLITQLHPSFQQ